VYGRVGGARRDEAGLSGARGSEAFRDNFIFKINKDKAVEPSPVGRILTLFIFTHLSALILNYNISLV
jgi:hypothetical protein